MKQLIRNQGTIFKATLLVVAAIALTACSEKQDTGSSDQASRATDVDTTDTSKAWAECSASTSSAGGFKVSIQTLKEATIVRNDLMYVKITSVPSAFTSSPNSFFSFFRWQASSAGTYMDPVALSFTIYSSSNSAVVLSSRTQLRWSDLQSAASSLGVSTPADFFNRVYMVVNIRDVNAAYDVLTTAYYNSSSVQQSRADTLLPIYNADPAGYATDLDGKARPSVLQSLHPFKSQTGLSVASYRQMANQMCGEF